MTSDKYGKPIRINLSARNVNYSVLLDKQVGSVNLKNVVVLADRAYSTYNIIENLGGKGSVICISPKSNIKYAWKYHKTPCKKRNEIERLFKRLKDNRLIATRYDRLDNLFISFVYFLSITFWII